MDVLKAIKTRRSIRYFKDKKVPKELITKIIDSARWAPSACNRQGWRFIIINDPKIRNKIVEQVSAYYINKVPTLILVCYSNRTDNKEYMDHYQSAGMAIQNMQLTAHSLGLGSCCADNLPPKYIMRRILGIPWHYNPIAFVSLGYPKVDPKPLPRKNEIEEIISYDKFNITKEDKISRLDLKLRIKRLLRFIYFRMPSWLKMLLYPIASKFEKKFDKYTIEL